MDQVWLIFVGRITAEKSCFSLPFYSRQRSCVMSARIW